MVPRLYVGQRWCKYRYLLTLFREFTALFQFFLWSVRLGLGYFADLSICVYGFRLCSAVSFGSGSSVVYFLAYEFVAEA